MRGNNLVVLQGHLGAEPEERYVSNQNRVVQLRVATNYFKKDEQGERSELTDWHRVDVWGKSAAFCVRYLNKGDKVQILGSIRNRVVEVDGKKRTFSSVTAWEVNVLTSIASRTPRVLSRSEAASPATESIVDALPF